MQDEAKGRLKGGLWWDLLLTTRVLLAHTGLHDVGDILLTTVIRNVHGILLLANVDISLKSAYSSVAGGNTTWIRKGIAFGGNRRLSLRSSSDADVLTALTCVDLSEVKAEFDSDLASDALGEVCMLLGRAIYRLVATRDSGWQVTARQFA